MSYTLVERLRDHARVMNGVWDSAAGLCKQAADEINHLTAELAEARKGAERYQTLREMDGGSIYALLGDYDGIHGEEMDARVDRAITPA